MPRLIDAQLKDRLSWKGAVCVEGPKWCGKTWSCQEQAQSSFPVGSPAGNFSNRLLAKENPMLALEGKTPHLIDEWQEAPGIWDAVRMEVDARGEYGQFILTGSSTPRIKGIMHSGTGRITKLRMRSMSLFEAGNSTGRVSVKDLFDGNFSDAMTGEIDIREIAMLITRGGWPGILPSAPLDPAGAPDWTGEGKRPEASELLHAGASRRPTGRGGHRAAGRRGTGGEYLRHRALPLRLTPGDAGKAEPLLSGPDRRPDVRDRHIPRRQATKRPAPRNNLRPRPIRHAGVRHTAPRHNPARCVARIAGTTARKDGKRPATTDPKST